MHLVTLDLEGVLIPEIWLGLADRTGIAELRRTTRDEPDYDRLMRGRLEILEKHGIGIGEVHQVVDGLDPLPGAVEFMDWLRSVTRVIILSDTFEEFAGPLMAKLGFPTLFCHSLEVSPAGAITDYRLRQPDQKRKAVLAFRDLGFRVCAAGDSYNDLTMLEAADSGILFRPPENLRRERPGFPVAADHRELRHLVEAALDAGS